METCNICNNSVYNPKKRIVKGKIVEQCVAKCHDKYIQRSSNSSAFVQAAKRSFKKAGITRL
jgi:hypothetical protein